MGEKETGAGEEAVVKTKTKSNQSNDRMADPDAGGAGDGDAGESAVNTSHSGIRNVRESGGISHEDDWDGHAGKLAPDKPGKSEIAIGDPGVNGSLTDSPPEIAIGEPGSHTRVAGASEIAVGDEGVPAAKPHSSNH